MKKLYVKPESESVFPEITKTLLDDTTSPDAYVGAYDEVAPDESTWKSNDSPIWDDTQK